MNLKQQTLYRWFAEGVVKNMLGTEVDTSAYIRPDYFFVIDRNGKESRSVWNEGLTQSIQKYISSTILIMEEQKNRGRKQTIHYSHTRQTRSIRYLVIYV